MQNLNNADQNSGGQHHEHHGSEDGDELDALDPREAMQIWLDRQRAQRAEASVESYRYRLKGFVEWLEDEGITNLNNLAGRDIYRFDSKRRAEVSVPTLNNQLGTIQRFLAFCADIEGVADTLPEKVDPPSVRKAERANAEKVSPERASMVLDTLARYEYASFDHALFAVMWHTGMRLGEIHALDVGDCYLTADDLARLPHRIDVDDDALAEAEPPFLYVHHRPETGTQLKNQEYGERAVALLPEVGQVLEHYIKANRPECQQDSGRRPLFVTDHGGRASKSTLRRRTYIIMQPCRSAECPHGREVSECQAREHGYESRCPSVKKPHAVRTGAITHHLDQGWSKTDLAARVNATPEVIDTHYDWPDEVRRMQSRRPLLDALEGDNDA
jgi:integrase